MSGRGAVERPEVAEELALLEPALGPLEAPVRSVLFGVARFEQHGRSLAQAQAVEGTAGAGQFFPRLADNLRSLQQARHLLEKRFRDGRHLGDAGKWLLDNEALLDEQIYQVRRGLPRNFFRKLPRLRDEPLAGLPRIYGIAWAWVAHTDGGFDTELLSAYLRAYQGERALALVELWALPTTMRVVLVENLRRLAERFATLQAARDVAHHWFDSQPETTGIAALERLEPRVRARGVADAFFLQLDHRLEELPRPLGDELTAWLSTRLPAPAAALANQQDESIRDLQSIRNAILTLRRIDQADWRKLIAAVSPVMQVLDSAPVHAAESRETQDLTLHAVERLARKSGRDELAVARQLVDLTRGIAATAPASAMPAATAPFAAEPAPESTAASRAASSLPGAAPIYWWRGPGRAELHRALGLPNRAWLHSDAAGRRPLASALYVVSLVALTGGAIAWLLGSLATGTPTALAWLTGLFLLGPVSQAFVALSNRWISESAPPSKLPRLAFRDGLGDDQRTIVVMPVMLGDPSAAVPLCAQLEQHFIANPEPQVQFALLSDFADAPAQQMPEDAGVLAAALAAVEALNLKHPAEAGAPARFLLLHRARVWSDSEQRWIGWERKRGKLEQLVRALADATLPAAFLDLGATSALAAGTRHLVTLDADTDMPPGRLRALVGTAAHPLNQPRVDTARRRITGGYAILQPRVLAPLPIEATSTPYHQLFSGQFGIDPYSAASSEIFQDLFGEGSFAGKGLIHVQAMHAVLDHRLPEGQVLSHDLLEGSIARCAGVSDITLLEDSPLHADVAHARLHRWTRGDWQLLPFLFAAGRYGIAPINRWKLFDNLRRSLVAPLSLALLLVVLATGVLPLGMTLLVVAAAFGAGPLVGAIAGFAPSRDDIAPKLFYYHAGADLLRALAQPLWHLLQLLALGLLYVDAIGRALWRQAVSHRHLLEWTTAAAAQAAARTDLPGLWRQHRRVPLAAALLAAALGAASAAGLPVNWPAAATLLVLWALSPVWTWWASRPQGRRHPEALAPASQSYLQRLARDTWRFYETHVGAADNHLPPDNVQITPHLMVAHRTSPTNIGMYLLVVACARELGFIGLTTMADRLQATLDTLDRLPRWNGHFYNWYDTQSLAVLTPAYVSAVDSGNCSSHLIAVARACEVAAALPTATLADTAQRALVQAQQRLRALQPALHSAPGLQALAGLAAGPSSWAVADDDLARTLAAQLASARAELKALRFGQGDPDENPSMWLAHDLVALVDSVTRDRGPTLDAARTRLLALAERARTMGMAADYGVLYDRERRLLHIGFRGETQQLDDNHYDLLASESRLTSLIAIAKGDVPLAHWTTLGRPFFAEGTEVGLKSWSGSMFEYLMPSLVLLEPPGSALAQAVRSAVREQQAEAQGRGTPWGISESAIAGQDHTLAYQYGPQGAPRLALARLSADERVLAPYASMMATMVFAEPAVANLQALEALGARGVFGFLEAVDYTPQRQTAGSTFTLVQTYMAHHQAMGLVALTNVLAADAPRRWLMSDAYLRAVTPLLHERAPREVAPLAAPRPAPLPRQPMKARMVRETAPLQDDLPLTQLLTNGRYAVVLRSHGGGTSSWDGIGLARWRDDLLRDACGSFFYVRRDDASATPEWHSLTAHPAPDPQATYRCRMQAERVILEAQWPDLRGQCIAWVSPEDDCELRQIELTNPTAQPVSLTLAACFEATLAPQRGDEAHPSFSNLFVQVRWDDAAHVLHLKRRPRLADEAGLQAVHFLAGVESSFDGSSGMGAGMAGAVSRITPMADRARWLGRYGSAARPMGDGQAVFVDGDADTAPDDPGRAMDTGLDPIAGLQVALRLPPGASVKLTFCTAAARDADTLSALIDKYRQAAHVERAASMSHTVGGIRLRELQFDTATWGALLQLNTLITGQTARDTGTLRAGSRCDRRTLWRFGISGDRPIVWVAISGEEGLDLVRGLKKAVRLWSMAGVGVDLVVSNDEPSSYLAPVHQALQQLQTRLQGQHQGRPANQCSALHVLREQDLSPDERATLQTLSRIKLLADGRSLAQHLDRWAAEHLQRAPDDGVPRLPVPAVLPLRSAGTGVKSSAAALAPKGAFDAEHGGFSFDLTPTRHPSRPWVNVLANPDFGCQVTELAAGYTWAGNSRMHQVTPWSNDPLTDPAGEWLFLHDLDQRRVWPLGRQLFDGVANEVEHGIGYTRLQQRIDGLVVTLTWCVDTQASVKQLQLNVAIESGARRRLRVVALAEWQLGSARSERLSVTTQPSGLANGPEGAGLPQPSRALALQATQLDHLGGFGQSTAFLALRPPQPGDGAADRSNDAVNGRTALLPDDWTCDRREFFDAAGALVLPGRLGQRSGAGLDACAALAAQLEPMAGQDATLTVLLGHAPHPAAADALLESAWRVDPAQRLARQRAQWPELLGGVQVTTPDARFDALVNHWLPYQTLVCRMWARAGFYQAGGAFGYRDQLQDAMALVGVAPQLLAAQIRRSSGRQFPEGDVQHWWHEPGGAGVRTHFSDDRLWLPYAVAHYLNRTGDEALLDETQPFLLGAQVPEGAEDIYETPATNGPMASLYEHAARAIDRSLANGAHGLPLFGTGDWNDGMNRVGHEGRGESVWLAWFLCQVIEDFTPLATARGDGERVRAWTAARDAWGEALDARAWDGRWYLRGFFDDGSPLGSSANTECKIDLIAQSWAVLSGAADPVRAQQAMASARTHLLDPEANLARLLHPPLARAEPSAGYIQAYAPGVRENGGQYNHAAVWALMAFAKLGQRESMWQVYTGVSPAHRWLDPKRGATYAIEPYVMAGDVYSAPPWVGRGGWSWYSGSAGWLLRASVESICGVVVERGVVRVQACLPPHWDRAEVRVRHGGHWHRFIVCANEAAVAAAVAREPQAKVAGSNDRIDLAFVAANSVHVLKVEAPAAAAPPAAARSPTVQG